MPTFTNSATLSYNGKTTTSNTVTGTIRETLTATKTAIIDSYYANSSITYAVNLVNGGSTALSNLTISDNLGAYEFNNRTLYPLTYKANSLNYFVNGVARPTPTVTADPPLSVTGISVPAGGYATIIYIVTVNEFAPLDVASTVTNTVTISRGEGYETIKATETVNSLDAPKLSIIKALSPTVVTDNEQITYTFTIQNTGNTAADATSLIEFADTFNPILNPITVTFNNVPWAATSNYNYNTATGVFETIAGRITVPAATYSRDTATGKFTVKPGVSTLVIKGTV